MAIIKPEQLSSGLYSISGSFSGSFHGDGSDLNNITASLAPNYVLTSSYLQDSASFDTRILNNSSSIDLLSGSFINFSGSYITDSSSFDTRILNNSSSIDLLSGSFINFSGSYLQDSASFDTRILNNSSSIDLLSGSFITFSGSYITDSASFDTRITNNSSSIDILSGSFIDFSGSYTMDSSSFNTRILNNSSSIALLSGSYLQDSASFNTRITNNSSSIDLLSGSYEQFTQTYNTGSFTGSFTGSLFGTSSWAANSISGSYSQTASYLNTLNQDLTFNGNLTLNGTASIAFLNVQYESASIIYSSGSNQLGDATDDIQTLIGTVIVSGSQQITGSLNVTNGITGSFLGTSSYASYAETSSNILGGKATHIPFFITDTTLATSSIYQSGSTSVIINQDNNTTANPEALYVWQPSTSSFNVISGKGNLDNYLQLNIQNTNQGETASSDVVATANNGNELVNYIDMGINGENFSGDIGGPNDAYLYSTGNILHIGNASNSSIQMFAGGFDSTTNKKFQLNPNNYHEMTGSLDVSGSLIVLDGITGSLLGTASYARQALSSSYAPPTFPYTGSAVISGSLTLTGSLNVSGSTTQVGNNSLLGNTTLSGSLTISGNTIMTGSITATNLTASFGYVSASFLDITGKQVVRGFTQYIPTSDIVPITEVGGYVYSSGSQGDLYFAQTNGVVNNVTRLRWIEGNMYSGLLNGAVITTQSATMYQVSSGSGIIVSINGSLSSDPYPSIQYISWPNLSASIAPLSASFDQSFIAIEPTGSLGQIYVSGVPYSDGQFNTLIPIGNVIHQNRTSINATATYPSVAYAYKQRSSDFIRAFGALKLSGLNTYVSASSTGSLVIASGTAYSDGRNYITDPNNPSYITDPGTNISKIFRYRQSGSGWAYDTNAGAGYSTIDPTQYSLNGVLTPVPGTGINRQWTIQRVYYFPAGATKGIYVYYGNTTYATQLEATANIPFENFIEAPNTAAGAVLSAYLVVRNNADFTDSTSYGIQQGGLFRSVGGSGGGGSAVTQTLSGLSDVSIISPTTGQPLVYNSTTLKWENASSLTATLIGNASSATSASYASTSSHSQTSLSGSYALTASYLSGYVSPFPYTGSAIITGSLIVTGSTTSTDGFTGSLLGTASYANSALSASYTLSSSYAYTSSYAVTASHVLGNVISASYAATASSAGDFTINDRLYHDGTLTHRSTVLSTIVGSNNMYTQATGSYRSAFGKYTLSNGANARAGEFWTVWNGTTTVYTDTSTADIGSTTTITFSSTVVGSNIQIDAIAGGSGWTIKMLTTFI